MLDYNNDNLNSNSIPSLRQKMINEALDYHQNMNSIVFKRQVKNIATYNNPSGKTDPSQGDILIEGTIKQKVGDIQSAIQRLNQTISYSNDVTMPQAVTPNTRGVAHVSGNGRNNRRVGGMDGDKPKGFFEKIQEGAKKLIPGKAPVQTLEQSVSGVAPLTKAQNLAAYREFRENEHQSRIAQAQAAQAAASKPPLSKSAIKKTIKPKQSTPYLGWEEDAQKMGQAGIGSTKEDISPTRHTAPQPAIPELTSEEDKEKADYDDYRKRQYAFDKEMFDSGLSFDEPIWINEFPDKGWRKDAAQLEIDKKKYGVQTSTPAQRAAQIAEVQNFIRRANAREEKKAIRERGESVSSSDLETSEVDANYIERFHRANAQRQIEGLNPFETFAEYNDYLEGQYGYDIPQQPQQPLMRPQTGRYDVPQQPQPQQPQQPQQLQQLPLMRPQTGRLAQLIQPQQPGQGGEPPAAGILSTQSPDARSSSKIKQLIDNSLAAIVSSYNSLMDYIDLQIKQRTFKPRDEQTTSALLKELIEPLKLLIANSAQVTERDPIYGVVEYSRIYNIINDIISKINSCPPFLKVDYRLLTEALPIRRDVIQMPGYSAIDQENHEYLDNLLDRLKEAYATQVKFHPKSQLEKEARDLKLREIDNYYEQITKAGYKPSYQHLEELTYAMGDLMDTEVKNQPTEEETQAAENFSSMKEAAHDIKENYSRLILEKEALTREFEEIEERYKDVRKAYDDYDAEVDFIDEQDRQLNDDKVTLKDQYLRKLKYGSSEDYASNMALKRDYTEDLEVINEKLAYNDEARQEFGNRRRKMKPIVDESRDMLFKLRPRIDDISNHMAALFDESKRLSIKSAKEAPLRRSHKSKTDISKRVNEEYYKRVPQRKFHEKNTATKELEKRLKYATMIAPYTERATIPPYKLFGTVGNGKPAKAYGGMRPHKSSEDPFGNGPELEPYLTKYLRPSKFRQVKDVPAIESSSEESSGEDEPRTVKRRGMGKRDKKLKEDLEIIETHIHPDRAILIEKKTKGMRVGRGKKMAAVKPAHVMRPEQDMWFM